MNDYQQEYVQVTGRRLPANANLLEPLFADIAAGKQLPPRGQQAVTLGLTAHTLTDGQTDPALFDYYRWVLAHYFTTAQINELTAKLIGMAFTSANVFRTDLPQPLTLNPWQAPAMHKFPLQNHRVIVIENNGVFVYLLRRHPQWPLVLQGGNDFNATYVTLIQRLEQRSVQFTYLGDLDGKGIQMAEHFFKQLRQTPIEVVSALQQPAAVAKWLVLRGKTDAKRTRRWQVDTPLYQMEMDSVVTLGKFVEQEQLIDIYEQQIVQWLAED